MLFRGPTVPRMTSSGHRGAALLLMAHLLAGCWSDDPVAAPAPSTAPSTAATSAAPAPVATSTAPATAATSTAPATAATSTAPATAATSTAPPSSAAAPSATAATPTARTSSGAAPATWPAEVPYPVQGRVWAVYVGVTRDGSAAERARLDQLAGELRAAGYAVALGAGPVACEPGAADALGVDPDAHGLPVFLESREAADQFLARWGRPDVGVVQTTETCTA